MNDQAWVVANDVSAALLYSEASAMTRHLVDDEKGLSIVQTLCGVQVMLVINESGLYSAILR
ncbi:Bro-N domain-containing protein, partial [Pseudomonas syringae pv. tagetis]